MSILKSVYTDIKTALGGITELQHVAIWNNQVNNEEQEDAYNFPAAFIEFSQITWEFMQFNEMLGNTTPSQKGALVVTLYVAFHELRDETESFTDCLDLVYLIYRTLNGIEGTNYTPFVRVSERQDTNHDNVLVWQMDFASTIYETNEEDVLVDATDGGETDIALDVRLSLDIDNFHIRTGDGIP